MKESIENKIIENNEERKIIDGYDFVKGLKPREILIEMGEKTYQFESEIRTDVYEIVSNLSRTLSGINDIHKTKSGDIEAGIDAAISPESKNLTSVRLSEEQKRIVKDIILRKLSEVKE